ncbi:MAG: PAS domain S-box protein [Deltaproteobacteria bacterium]|nr:PAS domain S-box protein [Deltaproteobacteria bacterium]
MDAELSGLLFQANPRPMWVFDRETRAFLHVNDAACALYGWTRDEMLKMTLSDVRPPSERAVFEASFAASKSGTTFGRVGRHWKKSGELIEVHLEITQLTYRGREIGLTVATNVTGIDDVERRFRLLIEHSAEAIAMTNENWIVEYVSPAAERILGYPASEVIGTSSATRAHPDDAAHYEAPKIGETRLNVARVRHRDGRWLWIESSTTNLTHDPAVRAYVTNYRDITERYTAQEALRRSEESFRALFERSPVATFVHRDGNCIYANDAAAAMLGYDVAAQLVGRPVLDFVHPDERAWVRARQLDVAQHGQNEPHESHMVRRDGRVITINANGVRIDFDGSPCNVVFVRDVTERHEMFTRAAVADRMVTVGTLAAGVAHEINNPLAYVTSNLEILAHDVPKLLAGEPTRVSKHELTTLVHEAREGVDRVSAIVRELRALARPEDEPLGPVDVTQVLASAIKIANAEIRHRARIVERYGPALPHVQAHASRLAQVFINLLVNAAQAMPETRSPNNEIRLRADVDGERVVVEIEDTGAGIPASIIHRIFDPFFTTKAAGVGMGLGLAISQQIVTAMHGEISVTSTPGVGTTFRVVLPAAASRSRRTSPMPAQAAPAPGGRILLVDDEPSIGRVIALLLSDDHEVVTVTRAREALERISAGEEFDVILCDLMMPEVSGIELYDMMSPADRARIVFMTGGAFTQQAREFLASSNRPRLQKPFTEKDVRTAIERVRSSPGTPRDPQSGPS